MKTVMQKIFLLFSFFCLLSGNAQTSKKKNNFTLTKPVTKTTPVSKKSHTGFDINKLQVGGNIQGDFSSQSGANSTNFGVSAFAGYKNY